MDELEDQITKARNKKAPGKSGVTSKAYKALSMEAKEVILKILCDFYNGDINPTEWHEATLKCLHKKGDTTNLNNWCMICLKDMSARLMSGILSACLATVIKEHGVKTQFGLQSGVGCLDGLCTL